MDLAVALHVQQLRTAIVVAARDFSLECKSTMSATAIRKLFCERYCAGLIKIPGWVRDQMPTISEATLRRWLFAAAKAGRGALFPKERPGRNHLIDFGSEIGEAILKTLLLPAAEAYRVLKGMYGNLNFSLATLSRSVRQWKKDNPQMWAAIKSPEKFKNSFLSAVGSSSQAIDSVNQLWEMDSTVMDLFELGGKRYSLLVIEEIYSRRCLAFVAPTSNAEDLINLGLRNALLKWGIPQRIKLDNGKDYRSIRLEHAAASLDIELDFCQVRSPWQKPHVERLIGTLMGRLAVIPGFCGHNVAERKEIESREKLRGYYSAPELQAIIDEIVLDYEKSPHSSLGCSPLEKWAQSKTTIAAVSNDRVLDLLLSKRKVVTVGKKGIRFENSYFVDAEGEWARWIGRQVEIRTTEDLGHLLIFEPSRHGNGKYLLTVTNTELIGNLREVAIKTRRLQRQEIAVVRRIRRKAQELRAEYTEKTYLTKRRQKDVREIQPQSDNVVAFERRIKTDLGVDPAAIVELEKVDRLLEVAQQPSVPIGLDQSISHTSNSSSEPETEGEKYHRLVLSRFFGEEVSEADLRWVAEVDSDRDRCSLQKKMLAEYVKFG